MPLLRAFLVALGLLGVAVMPVLADSPHFLAAAASLNSAGALVCTFSEAGLGNTLATEQITCSADAQAVYACINGGGNHPQAANKETVSEHLAETGSFAVRNGRTNGSLTLGPVGPGAFACPPGQTMVLASVSYTNISLVGLAGDTASVPGTLSKVFVPV